MASLSSEQARVADQAVAAVEAAVAAARAAIANESTFLTWVTGSESALAARQESLRQSERILADLRSRRPGLQAEQLVNFVELAGAGAQVGALLESARRMTSAGFKEEVVTPTMQALDPTNLKGPVGRVVAGVAILAVLFLLLKD